MRVVIPSYKRPEKVLTRYVFPYATIVVSESEEDEYRKNYIDPIEVLPDKVQGNISRVRNWILDNIEDDDIVMVDDDLVGFGYFEKGEEHIVSDPLMLEEFMRNGFEISEDLGVHLWGVNLQSDPKFYREYTPISFLSPVLACFTAHRKPELRYDESLSLNEDYDFFLRNISRYHKCLRFNKWHYKVIHFTNEGGVNSYRTMDLEKRQSEIMIKRWGNIVRYNFNKSVNPVLHVPIKGV